MYKRQVQIIARIIRDPKNIGQVITDWKHTPQRVVSLLWESLTMTAAYYVAKAVIVFAGGLFVYVALGACVVFTVLLLVEKAYNSVTNNAMGDFLSSGALTMLSVVGGVILFFVWTVPMSIASYQPRFLGAWLWPVYGKYEAPIKRSTNHVGGATVVPPTNGATVASEVIDDIDQVKVEDTGATVVEPTEETNDKNSFPKGSKQNPIKVELDGDRIASNPRMEGIAIAEAILRQDGNPQSFRRKLAKDLRIIGLNSQQVAVTLSGFDSKLTATV